MAPGGFTASVRSAVAALVGRDDPLPLRLARAARVAWEKGFLGRFDPLATPRLVRAAAAHGVGAHSLHLLHALTDPSRLAVADDHRALTYAGANDEISRLANALAARYGAGPGESVVLMMENRVEYVIAWFALIRLGARAVHASHRLTAPELRYLVAHSGARVALVSPSTRAVAEQLQRDEPGLGLRLIVAAEGPGSAADADGYEALRASASSAFPARAVRGAASENVVYTSGTTGKPKGAVRDFSRFGFLELSRLLERLPFHVGERHLVVGPLYHSAAQVFVMLMTSLSASVYLRPHFDAEDCLRTLSAHGIESLFVVPTMLRRLLQLPDEAFRAHPTPALRGLVSGSAEFPHALRLDAIRRFGAHAVHDFYGATELGWVTHIRGDEMLRKPGSVGRPVAGQALAILDAGGRPVSPGAVGTIWVRNAQTMSGYLHDRAATAATTRDGWMTVDDLGRVDGDGYLFLAGRERDMVKSGGVNLYPVEIEEVLARHPAVAEVAVVGVPDPEWGERLVGVVVPRTPGTLDTAGLEAFARAELAAVKVPRRWEVVDVLPRNATGKVVKTALRARLASPADPPAR